MAERTGRRRADRGLHRPSEYVPLWLEAAEEPGYIWVDQGSPSGADPARLHPGARANVERILQHASPSQP
jgi:hypothetical protein